MATGVGGCDVRIPAATTSGVVPAWYLGVSYKGGSKALSNDARIPERGGIKDIMVDNRIRTSENDG